MLFVSPPMHFSNRNINHILCTKKNDDLKCLSCICLVIKSKNLLSLSDSIDDRCSSVTCISTVFVAVFAYLFSKLLKLVPMLHVSSHGKRKYMVLQWEHS